MGSPQTKKYPRNPAFMGLRGQFLLGQYSAPAGLGAKVTALGSPSPDYKPLPFLIELEWGYALAQHAVLMASG